MYANVCNFFAMRTVTHDKSYARWCPWRIKPSPMCIRGWHTTCVHVSVAVCTVNRCRLLNCCVVTRTAPAITEKTHGVRAFFSSRRLVLAYHSGKTPARCACARACAWRCEPARRECARGGCAGGGSTGLRQERAVMLDGCQNARWDAWMNV